MYGELIHTEHQLESISEYYFDNNQETITELKSLINNRVRVYSYSLSEFKEMHEDFRITKCFDALKV
ncbi:MAG: hypothetical protein P8I82_04585 [Flavobacteriales bacterium]|mgnify:FL=1|nr:hypothetical protein [Flavobacteriales bacterium]